MKLTPLLRLFTRSIQSRSYCHDIWRRTFFQSNSSQTLGIMTLTTVFSPLYECEEEAEPPEKYLSGVYTSVGIGDTFKDGRYTIIHKLGWGSFATVWLARDNWSVKLYSSFSPDVLLTYSIVTGMIGMWPWRLFVLMSTPENTLSSIYKTHLSPVQILLIQDVTMLFSYSMISQSAHRIDVLWQMSWRRMYNSKLIAILKVDYWARSQEQLLVR